MWKLYLILSFVIYFIGRDKLKLWLNIIFKMIEKLFGLLIKLEILVNYILVIIWFIFMIVLLLMEKI